MDNIDDICKLPGYVFDKGFILGEVATTGEEVSSKNYRVRLISSEFETEGLLNGAYLPPDVQPETGMEIPQFVTIRYDADGLHVAKDNYFANLIAYFFSKQGQTVRDGTFPQWEQDWSLIFSKENYSRSVVNLTVKGDYCKSRWLECAGIHCRVPIREQDFLPFMEGPASFFPDTFYTSNRTVPRCLYNTDDENLELPLSFKVKMSLKKQADRTVHLFIHGFPSPAKWHYGVLKHVLGVPSFSDKDQRKYWENFEGMPVDEVQMNVFQNCIPNSNNKSCDEYLCLKNEVFSSVHQILRPYCRRYLGQALRFFPVSDSVNILVWKNQCPSVGGPMMIELECRRQIKIKKDNPFQALLRPDEMDRQESLILVGYSYDWHNSVDPTVHLFILTTFAYAIGGARQKIDVKKGYTLLDSGTLSNIESET
jgi:hypothetical protein